MLISVDVCLHASVRVCVCVYVCTCVGVRTRTCAAITCSMLITGGSSGAWYTTRTSWAAARAALGLVASIKPICASCVC